MWVKMPTRDKKADREGIVQLIMEPFGTHPRKVLLKGTCCW